MPTNKKKEEENINPKSKAYRDVDGECESIWNTSSCQASVCAVCVYSSDSVHLRHETSGCSSRMCTQFVCVWVGVLFNYLRISFVYLWELCNAYLRCSTNTKNIQIQTGIRQNTRIRRHTQSYYPNFDGNLLHFSKLFCYILISMLCPSPYTTLCNVLNSRSTKLCRCALASFAHVVILLFLLKSMGTTTKIYCFLKFYLLLPTVNINIVCSTIVTCLRSPGTHFLFDSLPFSVGFVCVCVRTTRVCHILRAAMCRSNSDGQFGRQYLSIHSSSAIL